MQRSGESRMEAKGTSAFASGAGGTRGSLLHETEDELPGR